MYFGRVLKGMGKNQGSEENQVLLKMAYKEEAETRREILFQKENNYANQCCHSWYMVRHSLNMFPLHHRQKKSIMWTV
jgi:hypothetical protein